MKLNEKIVGKVADSIRDDLAKIADEQPERLLPYADGFPKLFAKACGEIGIGVEDWDTAPAEALKRLLAKCDEMSAQA